MDRQTETIRELRAIIGEQQELLCLVLYVMSQGPIDRKWDLSASYSCVEPARE